MESSSSYWQPERYPFENDTEFVDIDEEEVAPERNEPDGTAPTADRAAEVLA